MPPKQILLIDIDALRPDAFRTALEAGKLPNIARLFGGPEMPRGVQLPMLSSAPSITFCAQASLFTGAHPNEHGVPGSEFFDRFGATGDGTPRHLAFDVGDTLAIDDAVRAFTSGLASSCLRVPTFYARMAQSGRPSIVAGNMYALGADVWLAPSVVMLGRFTKGGRFFGLEGPEYDRHVLDKLLGHIGKHGVEDGAIITMYFLGLDSESHRKGPNAQADYLAEHIDPMIGELWNALQDATRGGSTGVALFSDHGQIAVPPEEQYALRLGFPENGALGRFFDHIGIDVHDYPGEDPASDAVAALNGGLAHIYLCSRTGRWGEPPDLDHDILRIAHAFWEAHQTGAWAEELEGAFAGLLVRDVEHDGWDARYQALTPDGALVSLEAWFAGQPAHLYADPISRLDNLVGPLAGDILLISDYDKGYYFGGTHRGVHGGLHPDDSHATLVYGWPDSSSAQWDEARRAIATRIEERCRIEGDRMPTVADMVVGLEPLLGGEG